MVYVEAAIKAKKISGDGHFTKRCSVWLKNYIGSAVLLTISCTRATEMGAMHANIQLGDEVIMSSYTYRGS